MVDAASDGPSLVDESSSVQSEATGEEPHGAERVVSGLERRYESGEVTLEIEVWVESPTSPTWPVGASQAGDKSQTSSRTFHSELIHRCGELSAQRRGVGSSRSAMWTSWIWCVRIMHPEVQHAAAHRFLRLGRLNLSCFSRFLCLPLVCAVSVLHVLCLLAQVVQLVKENTHWVQSVVTSCLCLVFDSSTVVAELGSGTVSGGGTAT